MRLGSDDGLADASRAVVRAFDWYAGGRQGSRNREEEERETFEEDLASKCSISYQLFC